MSNQIFNDESANKLSDAVSENPCLLEYLLCGAFIVFRVFEIPMKPF
jgi:hypothetical protein